MSKAIQTARMKMLKYKRLIELDVKKVSQVIYTDRLNIKI